MDDIRDVFKIDASVLSSRAHPSFRAFAEIAGYDVLVLGEPLVFGPVTRLTTVSDFLLSFSGLNALCLLLPKDRDKRDAILSCDLYGLTEFYYSMRGPVFSFSLSMEPLISAENEVDEVSLFELYYNRFIYGHRTPFNGVSRNCPLTYLCIRFSESGVSAEREDLLPVGEPTADNQFGPTLEATVSTLPCGVPIALSYSGGVDSDAVFEALDRKGFDVAPVHYYYDDEGLRRSYENSLRRRKRLTVFRAGDRQKTLKLRWQGCAVHFNPDRRLDISRWAAEGGHRLLVTGQNADNLSQFGNTRVVPLRALARSIVLFGLNSGKMATVLTRLVHTRYPRLPRSFVNVYQRHVLGLAGTEFERAFLTVFTSRGSSKPLYRDLGQLAFLGADLYLRWVDRVKQNVESLLALKQLNFRQRLSVLGARGHLMSGDVRVFTSAAAMFGLKSFQAYSAPPMYRHFFNRQPSRRDTLWPKHFTRRYARYGRCPEVKTADILADRRNVDLVSSFGSLGRPMQPPLAEQLAYLESRYAWISRTSLYALRQFMGPDWGMMIAHLYGLVRRQFETVSISEESTLFEGGTAWASTKER